MARTLDVHHHLAPPAQVAALAVEGALLPIPTRGWSIVQSLEALDQAGIDMAMLSVAPPGLRTAKAAALTVARACNDDARSVVDTYPTRFGFFATLPLSDVAASILEADYALDRLGAAGVLLFTNIAGRYLGDPAYVPLLDHLDARSAGAFVHPISHRCCCNVVPDVSDTVIEYGAETARTLVSLLISPAHRRRSRLKMIFSHAGGVIPALTQRLTSLALQRGEPDPEMLVFRELQRFFYDTAQAGNRINLTALRHIAPLDHMLFGSDFPFAAINHQVQGLRNSGLDEAERLDMLAANPLPFNF